MLRSNIAQEMLPRQMGYGSGVTCWRRLGDWQEAGVWQRLHQELLQRLHKAGPLELGLYEQRLHRGRGKPPGRTRRTEARREPNATC